MYAIQEYMMYFGNCMQCFINHVLNDFLSGRRSKYRLNQCGIKQQVNFFIGC